MSTWTRISSADAPAVFTRPLGQTETVFYWDSVFAGANDIMVEVMADVKASHAAHLFSPANVTRTWTAVKNIHPILGASLHERNDDDAHTIDFIVAEDKLSTTGPDELMFRNVQSDADALSLINTIMNGPRTLSNERPAQVWFLSLPQSPSALTVRLHVLFLCAHGICDGGGFIPLIISFFDILTHEKIPNAYAPGANLGMRLAHVLSMEDVTPSRKYTLARQKWRQAVAKVIHQRRKAALQGGHTLPQRLTPHTFATPAISRALRFYLPKDVSQRIIASCEREHLTIGSVLPVLAQLAFSRVLHRLRARGAIRPEEWRYRKAQPMHMSGVINMRRYLDPVSFKGGLARNVGVATGPSRGFLLPAMPTADSVMATVPSFEDLLSKRAFLHRCRSSLRQMQGELEHPLLVELSQEMRTARLSETREAALNWRRATQQETNANWNASDDLNISAEPMPLTGQNFLSNICATLANYDKLSSFAFPLDHSKKRRQHASAPEPLITLDAGNNYQRCEPAELYLLAMTVKGALQLVGYCDIRVYEEAMVMEWLGEAARAAEWYLGSENRDVRSKL